MLVAEGKRLFVHRDVLVRHSDYFAKILETADPKKQADGSIKKPKEITAKGLKDYIALAYFYDNISVYDGAYHQSAEGVHFSWGKISTDAPPDGDILMSNTVLWENSARFHHQPLVSFAGESFKDNCDAFQAVFRDEAASAEVITGCVNNFVKAWMAARHPQLKSTIMGEFVAACTWDVFQANSRNGHELPGKFRTAAVKCYDTKLIPKEEKKEDEEDEDEGSRKRRRVA